MISDSYEYGAAEQTAEEILRTIYGDDFKGCTVRLETIASIVGEALKQGSEAWSEMRGLYEKAIEALHLLSTPPASTAQLVPENLPELLSSRLDTIHQLTQRLIDIPAAGNAGTSLSTNPT